MYASVAAGAIVGALTQILGFKDSVSIASCVAATGLVEVTCAIRYTIPQWKAQQRDAYLPVRRRLVYSALSAALLLIITRLQIPQTEALAAERKLQQASLDPADSSNIKRAKLVLAGARAAQIPIASSTLDGTGKRFVDASARTPESWNAALEFVNYKSSLKKAAPSLGPSTPSDNRLVYYFLFSPHGMEHPSVKSGGVAPRADAAQYDIIGRNQNAGLELGNAFLIATGGAQILDGMQFKNVIFQGVEIYYNGGPVLLTNVTFINCTFKMIAAQNSRGLATAILSPSESTTFSGE